MLTGKNHWNNSVQENQQKKLVYFDYCLHNQLEFYNSIASYLNYRQGDSSEKEWLSLSTNFTAKFELVFTCTLFRMGGKALPTCPSPITSTNVGLSPKAFLILVWTLLPPCRKISRSLVPVPNFWPRPPLKKSGFSGQILIKLTLW